MVAAFLRAELASTRFGDDLRAVLRSLGADEARLADPGVTDARTEALRARVLGAHRGYRRDRGVFAGLPDGLTWYAAELSRADLAVVRCVDYSYWNALTDDTHLVGRAVANIRRGRTVFDVPNDRFFALADEIRRGAHAYEPMILYGTPLTILEGHLRAVALGLAGERAPAAIPVIVGLAHRAPAPHT